MHHLLRWTSSWIMNSFFFSTTEFFFFQQSLCWAQRFDPETQAGFEFPGRNIVFNKTIAGKRRTLLLNVKPARMSVKTRGRGKIALTATKKNFLFGGLLVQFFSPPPCENLQVFLFVFRKGLCQAFFLFFLSYFPLPVHVLFSVKLKLQCKRHFDDFFFNFKLKLAWWTQLQQSIISTNLPPFFFRLSSLLLFRPQFSVLFFLFSSVLINQCTAKRNED